MANNFFDSLKEKLLNRKKQVTQEIKLTTENDPFRQELKDDGFRNLDETGEEASDTFQHQVSEAIKEDLVEEKENIDNALKKMKSGEYGVCEVCGKKIPEERLKIKPTATKCVDCELKSTPANI